jgi:hypothetical protein
MNRSQVGRILPLSVPRRLVCDLLYFARKVPSVPVQRFMRLADLADARSQAAHRISWCTLFVKAYGQVARQMPELRRAFLRFPYARLYEHPCSIASVAVERLFQGEHAVLFAHLRAPEDQSLVALEDRLRHFKEAPIETVGLYRRALRVSRLPLPLRRLLWWIGLNFSGAKRARTMGTFGVSVYSGLGAESLHPLSPLTTTLNYGVIQTDGTVAVRLIYDHRALDGATVARALALLQDTLLSTILDELREGTTMRAA